MCHRCLEGLQLGWTIRLKCIESDSYLRKVLEDRDSEFHVKVEPLDILIPKTESSSSREPQSQEQTNDEDEDEIDNNCEEPNLSSFSMKMEVVDSEIHGTNNETEAFDFVNFSTEAAPAKKHKKKKKKQQKNEFERPKPVVQKREEGKSKEKDQFQCSGECCELLF